ncbi:hypothetical protein ACFW5D_33135 [Streptomyces sp. NPDC058770]|uniref:hypothetical protein n=1 Tax=Streptomyces sp. NPDC058770 TaxID=3346631 RepID=UPI0036A62F6B
MGFDPSYVSHVESGRHKPSEEFSRLADEALNAGKAIWRRWCDYEQAKARTRRPLAAPPAQRRPEQPYATGSALVVEHDAARLQYDGSSYRLTMRRRLRNTGDEPVTRYLIRISVDRYPGNPEQSNAHYQAHPLTWEELGLTATCRGETMRWQAKHDRDAFKEVWLLFDNETAASRSTRASPCGSNTCTRSATTNGATGSSELSDCRPNNSKCSSPSPPPSTPSCGAPRPP